MIRPGCLMAVMFLPTALFCGAFAVNGIRVRQEMHRQGIDPIRDRVEMYKEMRDSRIEWMRSNRQIRTFQLRQFEQMQRGNAQSQAINMRWLEQMQRATAQTQELNQQRLDEMKKADAQLQGLLKQLSQYNSRTYNGGY